MPCYHHTVPPTAVMTSSDIIAISPCCPHTHTHCSCSPPPPVHPLTLQVDRANIDALLVGDSVAMVVHGHDTTLPITLEDMLVHFRAVARGVRRAFLIGDLPFGSYETGPRDAVKVCMGKRPDAAAGVLRVAALPCCQARCCFALRLAARLQVAPAEATIWGTLLQVVLLPHSQLRAHTGTRGHALHHIK